MNVLVPLNNLRFLPEFYYPIVLQKIKRRTILERAVQSIGVDAQYHFVVDWNDYTKYFDDLEKVFPGCKVSTTKNRIHGTAEMPLFLPLSGPTLLVDPRAILRWDSSSFFSRIEKRGADVALCMPHRRIRHIKMGGYHPGSVSNLFIEAPAYFFRGEDYAHYAPQVIDSELQMDYKPVEVFHVINKMIDDGARCIYHRVGCSYINSVRAMEKIND